MYPRRAKKWEENIGDGRGWGRRMARADTIYNYVFIYFIAPLNAFRKDKTNNISSVRQEEIKRHYVTLLSGSGLLELKLFANCHRCHDCHAADAHLGMLCVSRNRDVKSNQIKQHSTHSARSPDRTKASRCRRVSLSPFLDLCDVV